ncbi:MAG TPA: ATP-binding protein [Candidatus Angelobacter sp.]|nr:ATP-binding protein [Candidatus Angelobacter sp.]
MGRVRLKTKLVMAITGMVFALAALFSFVYVSHRLRQSTTEAYIRADFVVKEIEASVRRATQVDLNKLDVDLDNPEQVQASLERRLQEDDGLATLLQSILAYSDAVYDAGITDVNGRAIVHTDTSLVGTTLEHRENYGDLLAANFVRQLQLVYGPPRVYDLYVPIKRGTNQRFGFIRVGISTVFLKNELSPQLNRAMAYSAVAILLSLAMAAIMSNLVLHPLEAIGRRLDLMTAEVADSHPLPDLRRVDEFGLVNTKIDRLGRQIRDVKEVFTTLKGNLDQVLGSLQDGVVLFTSENDVVLVSASAEKFLGRSRDQTLGKPLGDIFTDATKLGRIVLDAFALHQGISQREIELENGRRVQIALEFIAERGQRIGALLTMRDAESVRRFENELEVAQRMVNIGRLTSGVAHEVRNPINAIVVHLELLREKMRERDGDTGRHMDIIDAEMQRLDRVVQTLGDFNRPVEPNFTPSDLRRLTEDVAMLATPDAARSGVSIETHLGTDALPVNADNDLMKQALLNIVLNGVQAMEHGGTLAICTRLDEVNATIEVRDEGSGIPPEIRDKVFQLFFTTKKTGNGIGLARSYRVLQLHGGSLSFESEVGKGTVFRLSLPLAVRQEAGNREVTKVT